MGHINMKDIDRAVCAMIHIEGAKWALENEAQMGNHAVLTAHRNWKRAQERSERRNDPWILKDFGAVIYGYGGHNRYFLRGNGTVEFSARHSSAKDVVKARELGFKVVGESY